MKKLLANIAASDVVAFIGASLVSYGAWRVYLPAGFIVGGAFLLAGALFDARSRAQG